MGIQNEERHIQEHSMGGVRAGLNDWSRGVS